MAMALFKQKIQEKGEEEEWTVSSAGTWGRAGMLASENGRVLMESRGLDLSEHRSRIVTREMLAAADIVLTMEKGHKEALRLEFPEFGHRIHMLSEMIGIRSDVDDPYGGTLDEYDRAVADIEHYIEDGFARIREIADQTLITR